MATLQELRGLFGDSDLLEKVEAATIIAANNLLSGTPTLGQKIWAATVFNDPKPEARKALLAVLATNAAATVEQIQSANDSSVQSNVDAVTGTLVDAMAGV